LTDESNPSLPPSHPPTIQVEKCKRFLLEFEGGAFMVDQEEDGDERKEKTP